MFDDKTKILIIRLSSIGDIILTTPIIRQVRNKFPQAQIDFLLEDKFYSILKYNPYINTIIRYNKQLKSKQLKSQRDEYLRKNIGKYDIVIDLHNNFRTISWRNGIYNSLYKIKKYRTNKIALVYFKESLTNRHIVDKYFEAINELSLFSDDLGLEFFINSDDKDNYESNLHRGGRIIKIGIAPGAHHFTKQYPKDKFINLINNYLSNYKIHLFGGIGDYDICKSIMEGINKDNNSKINITNHCNLYDLQGTAKKINEIDLMITNDTGLMHIAAARGKRIIALFGSTVSEFGFTPYKVDYKILEVNLNCRPCTHIGRSNCPKKHFDCMNLIEEKSIYNAIKDFEKQVEDK